MIESFNDVLSLVSLLVIVLGMVIGFYKMNKRFKKNQEVDEYYRDLL